MEYVVETHKLTKSFGREHAVDKLDMLIPKGEVYGFLGPNGAGKTTTIRMLLGLMKASSGHIRVFNQDLRKDKLEILRKVGSLVESPSYYPHLTAYENLEAWRKIVGVPKARIVEVLDIVRLSDVGNKKVKGFSLGMKQRLGIAASLLNTPDLLILDEPNWKQLLALPVSKHDVYLAKFILLLIVLLTSSVLLVIFTIAGGFLLGIGADGSTIPYRMLLEQSFYPLIASLPVLAFHLWIATVSSNQGLAILFGIVGTMCTFMSAITPKWLIWNWPAYVNDWHNPLMNVGLCLIAGLILYTAGVFDFVRRDVK